MNKICRIKHRNLGWGWQLKDKEGLCKPEEIIFMPDNGLDKVESAHSQYAFNQPATFDIFKQEEFYPRIK